MGQLSSVNYPPISAMLALHFRRKMQMFILDSRLSQDTHILGAFPLSLVLLSCDENFPWCILVPQKEGVREIHHLSHQDQVQLLMESSALAQAMEACFKPDKMNVAALGNVVPQLHVHHVARFTEDPCWPKPIWGQLEPKPYEQGRLEKTKEALNQQLESSSLGFNKASSQ